jgi:hypothetical protein
MSTFSAISNKNVMFSPTATASAQEAIHYGCPLGLYQILVQLPQFRFRSTDQVFLKRKKYFSKKKKIN